MAYDRYAVVKVKDAEPEIFWLIFSDSEMERDGFMFSGEYYDEKGTRAELAKMGLAPERIEELMKKARDNPR